MRSSNRVTGALRRAIAASGHTRYRIAKETGVSEAALSRFMSGERGMALPAVDKLAAFLGLALVSVEGKKTRGSPRKGG